MPEYIPKIPEPTEEQIRTALISLIAHYHNPVKVFVPGDYYNGPEMVLDIPVERALTKTAYIECDTGHRFDLQGNAA